MSLQRESFRILAFLVKAYDQVYGSETRFSKMIEAWQRLGVATTRVTDTPQQAQDLQRDATFPAFTVRASPNDTLGFLSLHSSRARLASNGFRAPAPINRSRYISPELDGLVDRYLTTVPMPERIQVVGEIIHHVADQVVGAGILYSPAFVFVGDRLVNFTPSGREIIWNAHEWDIRGREA